MILFRLTSQTENVPIGSLPPHFLIIAIFQGRILRGPGSQDPRLKAQPFLRIEGQSQEDQSKHSKINVKCLPIRDAAQESSNGICETVTGSWVNSLTDEPDVVENKHTDQNCGGKGRQPGRYARDEDEPENDL